MSKIEVEIYKLHQVFKKRRFARNPNYGDKRPIPLHNPSNPWMHIGCIRSLPPFIGSIDQASIRASAAIFAAAVPGGEVVEGDVDE